MGLVYGNTSSSTQHGFIKVELKMINHEACDSSLRQPWTSAYAKIMALVLLYGATVHIGNMAGLDRDSLDVYPVVVAQYGCSSSDF